MRYLAASPTPNPQIPHARPRRATPADHVWAPVAQPWKIGVRQSLRGRNAPVAISPPGALFQPEAGPIPTLFQQCQYRPKWAERTTNMDFCPSMGFFPSQSVGRSRAQRAACGSRARAARLMHHWPDQGPIKGARRGEGPIGPSGLRVGKQPVAGRGTVEAAQSDSGHHRPSPGHGLGLDSARPSGRVRDSGSGSGSNTRSSRSSPAVEGPLRRARPLSYIAQYKH